MFTQGVAYYPDYLFDGKLQLQENGQVAAVTVNEHILADLVRMKNLGISLVRVGEFAWQHLEPRSGEYYFDRFNFTLNACLAQGISVMFCTPTACPPAWLVELHPDMLPRFPDGTTVSFGSRRHYDPLNPAFREHARQVTSAVVNEFKNHPAISAWQLDNEWGHHGSAWLWTTQAEVAFRKWLESRYASISFLNQSWFTAFWSQTYSDFNQIPLPRPTLADHNPSLLLDYRRFCTEVYRNLQAEHLAIVREACSDTPVTHNYIPSFFDLCPWEMSKDLDFVGYDHYQVETHPTPHRSLAQFALMKSLRKDTPFMVLEQQPLQVNWQTLNRRIDFDWLFLWNAQARASGANGLLYFSWQRFCGGPEQYHDAILSHDVRVHETKQEKTIKAISQFHREFSQLIDTAAPDPEVVIVLNTASIWTHEITAQSDVYKTLEVVDRLVTLFSSVGLGIGFIPEISDILTERSAKLLVLPGHAFSLSEAEQTTLNKFRAQGGGVLSLPRTALKDSNAKAVQKPLDFYPLNPLLLMDSGAMGLEESEPIISNNDHSFWTGDLWAEQIEPSSSWQPVATFAQGIYSSSPAALLLQDKHRGRHLHLATIPVLSESFHDWLLSTLSLEGVCSFSLDANVQAIPINDGLICINFGTNNARSSLDLSKRYHSLAGFSLTNKLELHRWNGETRGGGFELPARSVTIFRLSNLT